MSFYSGVSESGNFVATLGDNPKRFFVYDRQKRETLTIDTGGLEIEDCLAHENGLVYGTVKGPFNSRWPFLWQGKDEILAEASR